VGLKHAHLGLHPAGFGEKVVKSLDLDAHKLGQIQLSMGTAILDLLNFKFKFDPPVRRKKSKKKPKKTNQGQTVNRAISPPEPIDQTDDLPSSHVRSSPPLPDLADLHYHASGPHPLDANPQEVIFNSDVPVTNDVISPVRPAVADPNEMIHPAFRDDNPTVMLAAEPKILGEDPRTLYLIDVLTLDG
jgi:hypothetical protein